MSDTPIQTVTLAGEDYAVVPLAEYEALRNAVNEDAIDAATMKRVLEDPDQELVPFTLVKRIADGEHPVRVWREYRGMRAGELATAAGIANSYLSDIENGKKPGSINAMRRIAIALDVSIDDLI
ncbi:MAG: helix-turn-helix transcriptional regulator [Spirochaetaceae bacterium]|nr:helix-turn-helix transcriptional regulator [Spirochaetaceae bacterium]